MRAAIRQRVSTFEEIENDLGYRREDASGLPAVGPLFGRHNSRLRLSRESAEIVVLAKWKP